jgi:hypothetical protein
VDPVGPAQPKPPVLPPAPPAAGTGNQGEEEDGLPHIPLPVSTQSSTTVTMDDGSTLTIKCTDGDCTACMTGPEGEDLGCQPIVCDDDGECEVGGDDDDDDDDDDDNDNEQQQQQQKPQVEAPDRVPEPRTPKGGADEPVPEPPASPKTTPPKP